MTPVRVAATAAALCCLALLGASPASAAFEQVGCFAGSLTGPTDSCKPVKEEKFGEEVQLGGLGGMAVNYTGAGGVPAGTVYAATTTVNGSTIAMFTPTAEGLSFSLRWELTTLEGPYNRCGPALATKCAPSIKGAPGKVDVDVDQATGNVYVYNGTHTTGFKGIVEYDPTGSEVITRFGEIAPSGKTTAETPNLIHDAEFVGAIAVNNAGEVYIYDLNAPDNFYHRLMKFRPKVPGKFDEYEYAGASEDIGAGFKPEKLPLQPVADAAGNLYVVSQEASIEMYDPAHPGDPPVCVFSYPKGGIVGITVNPQTGDAFFFSYKAPKRVRRLGPCNPATGKFAESEPEPEAFTLAPERDDLYGLAFDPVRQIDPARAPGVLYGGAPAPVSNNGVGEGEKGQSSLGYVFAGVKEVDPEVKVTSVSHVTATGALLEATINPNGFDTEYAFQYLSAAEYEANPPTERFAGASEAPPGGGTVKGGEGARDVATAIGGLSPDTEYRYRAVAVSECASGKACEGEGEAMAFRTFALPIPGLPDKRAYELVSPPQKHGGQVLPAQPGLSSCGSEATCKPGETYEHFPMQSSPDGDAVVYEGTSFDPETGVPQGNAYIAHRDPVNGWQSVNLTPSLLSQIRGYKALSESLSEALLVQLGPAFSAAAPPEYENLYTQPTSSPFAPGPLLTAAPPSRPAIEAGAFKLRFSGASADLSRVFFAANDVLSAEDPGIAPKPEDGGPTEFNLYEWEAATGQLRLVNVFPGNATTEAGAAFGVETSLFGVPSAHPVSADGSRAFFSDKTGQVYVREDASLSREIPDAGKFLSASRDGSKVLLANGHIYDLETEETIDLSEGKGGFEGIAGQSEDLSHVYFIDTEVLSGEEANSEGDKAQAGKFNLYAWSEEEPTMRYVATLIATDNNGTNLTRSQSWASLPSQRTAQASPNGRYLAFLSQAPLTDFDNTGPCETNHASGFIEAPCPEVFAYDSQTEALTCASCNPSGVAPLGLSALRLIKGGPELPQPRYLTDEGRLYFDSQDTLSLTDTNDGVEDVYQYEPDGIGTCEREAGCVSLISAGTGSVDSNFLTIDETGANVFFTTRDQLVLKDKDELIDLYDAREEGGIASETETQRTECQGEACQPAPRSAEDPPTGIEGDGNVTGGKPSRTRCPKGKRRVASRGRIRCVQKGRKGSQKHRAHAKKGGRK